MRVKQTDVFQTWWDQLQDERTKALIAARLSRLDYGLAANVRPVSGGISELPIHPDLGVRVYFQHWHDAVAILLCGGEQSTKANDLQTAEQLAAQWTSAMARNTHRLTSPDPAKALITPVAVETFMTDAFETNDAGYIAHALGIVARTRGMTQVAQEAGLSREQLYRSFSRNGNPTLKTTLALIKVLGLELTANYPD